MSSAPGVLPHKAISEMFAYALSRRGRTIGEIEAERSRRYEGDGSQEQYRDLPVWHNRRDLIAFVAEGVKIHPSYVGPKRTSSDFYNAIDQEIDKSRRKGLIANWNGTKPDGIFRVVKSLPTAAGPPRTSTEENTAAGRPGLPLDRTAAAAAADLRRLFLSILAEGKKDNTYKFTLAKSLLDYCDENPNGGSQTHEIPYEYFADKFLYYYWYQEYKFKMKQDFHVEKKPKVITVLHEVFGKDPPADFDLLEKKDKQRAKKRILSTVFGSARSKTSLVIPKFQKIPVGGRSEEHRVFYDYDDDKKILSLRPEAFEFLRQNRGVLSKAVLAEWAKFLERINHRLPRLIAKIELEEVLERSSLTPYRTLFSKHTDHCFYCATKLERDYTHVDHFIPWSYIFDDHVWNFVLACQHCNLTKSASLPQEEFKDELIRRNSKYYGIIKDLRTSLQQLDAGRGWKPEIERHYDNCKEYGFNVIRMPGTGNPVRI